jgi:hypothetical protein
MSTDSSNDRASLCSFTFTDGRQCRTPRAAHPYLCVFHARKDAQALAAEAAGKDIAYHLSGAFVSACDLSSALGRLFSAVAQGQIKPKTASTLAYLAQSLVQTCPSPRKNTSKPTTPTPGATPSAPPTNNPPITLLVTPTPPLTRSLI